MEKTRCPWVGNDPLYMDYHDFEWGIPQHDDHKLFEAVILDGFQAGLSWITILRKRENFRKAFDQFDAHKMAAYDETKLEELMLDAGIIRNRAKIYASVGNAKAYLATQKEFGSFDKYIWSFTENKTIQRNPKTIKDYIASFPESDTMAKDMKKRGFKFCGTTICYAFMQAVGIINDHTVDCHCYKNQA